MHRDTAPLKQYWRYFAESLRWAAGSYGIPKAASGCPYADGFQCLI